MTIYSYLHYSTSFHNLLLPAGVFRHMSSRSRDCLLLSMPAVLKPGTKRKQYKQSRKISELNICRDDVIVNVVVYMKRTRLVIQLLFVFASDGHGGDTCELSDIHCTNEA